MSVEVIAELSCNHLGSLDRALALVDAAATAGANTVKIQTDPPDGGLTIDCDRPEFRIKGGPWNGRKMIDLYRETWTPWEWTDTIATYAKMRGVAWLSTPGSVEAVEFLEAHGCQRYKVGSFDITDVELLQAIAKTGKPVLVSTGCATLDDIHRVLDMHLCSTALHCVSRYPAPVEEAALAAMVELRAYFAFVGLSDHSPGFLVPVMAATLGATVIEKHLTLSRADGGPDAAFSMEPAEFAEMVRMVRLAEQAMEWRKTDPPRQFVKSLYVVADIAVGERFTRENVRAIRPGHGMHPVELPNILGKQATRSIKRGEPLDASMVAPYGVIV